MDEMNPHALANLIQVLVLADLILNPILIYKNIFGYKFQFL